MTGSCGEGTLDDAYTDITVVNENVKSMKMISVEIPDLMNDVLQKIGYSDAIKFNFLNSYNSFTECCIAGPNTSTVGRTSLNISSYLVGKTVFGVPIYPPLDKYITIDLLKISLFGGGSADIIGEYKGCMQETKWSGEGNFKVNLSLSSQAKAKLSNFLVLQGKVEGKTELKEGFSVNSNNLSCFGSWSGINLKGTIIILVSDFELISGIVDYNIIHEKRIEPFYITLPSLN